MTAFEHYTDEELLSRLREGQDENEIVDYILNKYKHLVLIRSRMLFLAGGDQEDLVQEGMLGLFKAVRDFRPDRDTSFSTFASLCVERQLYQAIERSTRKKQQPLNEYIPLSEYEKAVNPESPDGNPESIVIGRENEKALRKQITGRLSSMENKVLDLYLEGKEYVEIARELGRTPKSIDNALQRIRSKVRQLLE